MRNPATTAGAATALMVGVAVVTVFTVLGASIKASIGDVVRSDFHGDLVIVNNGQSGSGIDPTLVGRLETVPEVRDTTGFGIARATVDGSTQMVTAADAAELGHVIDLHVAKGTLADVGTTGVAVSSKFADEHGLALGDGVPVTFGDGAAVDLRVGALYDANSSFGDVVVPESAWARTPSNPRSTGVFVTPRRRRVDRAGSQRGRGRRRSRPRAEGAGQGRVPRRGELAGRHPARDRLRVPGPRDPHRLHGHRQHVVALPAGAHA